MSKTEFLKVIEKFLNDGKISLAIYNAILEKIDTIPNLTED